ncbi:hypothetical protein HMPREF9080_03022 [Cardiobacterium valvarum F0432]|uniref:Uncharacterized protein n=1 Tax=Cardiobacterium valvarum F0432 TaxID=797473 RepID=G9ZJQ2_9GAMM|nr:hypothetical protein HMPREF9080_03022 [Cardiobacterium valvarum F0432]
MDGCPSKIDGTLAHEQARGTHPRGMIRVLLQKCKDKCGKSDMLASVLLCE